MSDQRTLSVPIPGTHAIAHYTYDVGGRLIRLTCGAQSQRVYVERLKHTRIYDGGFVTTSEVVAGQRLLRQVEAGDAFWVEAYTWDANGRLIEVDGVRVERDAHGRVTACAAPDGTWRYTYSGAHVTAITCEALTPGAATVHSRSIKRGLDGRAIRVAQAGNVSTMAYDDMGARADVPSLPSNYHRDAWGRLWTVTDESGEPIVTYLWDRYVCLGRIDGAPGEPLSAVFSLDPTGTPVRVITRTGVLRISRDAYGENLLSITGVPGLYGATIYSGLHYLAARALDPLSGSYSAPDPLDGKAGDPRRAGGYHGPLMVEHPAAGPYAVCQHDPISRTDPTGAFSWWILLTDFTWASQNNMVGLLGFDFIFNFWGSLFSGNIGAFFDREFFYSEQAGTWGWRSDGVIGKITGGRAFSFQHQIWSPAHEFNVLDDARAFVPQAAFRPALYGSMLRGKPKERDPFLLVGDANLTGTGLRNWTRAGGTAEAVVPGSLVPVFPSGGLHFQNPILDLRGVPDCTVTELEPTGALSSGNVGDRLLIDVPATGLRLNPDALVLLTDATKNAYIEPIAAASEEGGRTRLYFKQDIPGLGPNNVRLRGLGAPSPAENINHGAATPPAYLDSAGTTQAYAAGDPVRLKQGANFVGAALIDRLEAKVQIDAPLTGLTPPLSVYKARSMGVGTAATLLADADRLDSTPPPAVGDAVVIANGAGASLAASVIERSGNQWRVDRPVQPTLGAAGAAVTWERLAVVLTPLGRKDSALEADATLVYRAEAARSAPTGDFVVLRDSINKQAVRVVSGMTYDAIVLATPLPGNVATPYSVERFAIQAPNQNDLTISKAQSLVLNPPISNDAVALYFQQFPAATMATGATVSVSGAGAAPFTVNGTIATINTAGVNLTGHNTLRPSAVIGFVSGTTVVPALIKQVRVSVTLDRQLVLAANGLEAVPLQRVGWAYDAVPLPIPGGSFVAAVITVKPRTNVPAPNTRVQMPRFQTGEFVEVDYGAAGRRLFRIGTPAGDPVKSVDGMTLGLVDDFAPAPPPATVTVQRMEPMTPSPATGGSRLGIHGSAIAGAGALSNQATFDVWSGDGLSVGQAIAIVSGAIAYPALINTIDKIEVEFAPLATVANGSYNIAAAAPNRTAASPSFTREGGTIVVPQQDLIADAARLVLAIPFKEGTIHTDGSLSGGTVIVPDETDDRELTRLDSLKAHELTHTRQWSAFGPLMLFGFPTFILEGIVEATTEIALPEYSPYVPGTIVREGTVRLLQIPNPGDIEFNSGDKVQLSWASSQPGPSGPVTAPGAGVPHTVDLGAEDPADSNRFHLAVGRDVLPNEVANLQVRRHRDDNDFWARTLDVLQAISAGGLMNLIGGTVYGGLFNLIGRGHYALFRLIFQQGKTFPATIEGTNGDLGKLLRVTDADGREALAGASRIIVEKGDSKLVRDVERIDGEVVRLTAAIDATGEVRVAPYSTFRPDSTFDWHQYYPATIPDVSRPATVQVEPASPGDTLQLDPFDRVQIVRGAATYGRTVTAVAGNLVDLNEAVPGTETLFRIAKIGETDPIGNFDSVLLTNEFGMDWLRWVFDPYSQLQYDLQPDPSSFAGILARLGRYAFGASSWSFIWASVLTIDRVHQAEYLARIEQAASSNSGDTYSPLGRLREDIAVVGDIARYWQVPLGGARDFDIYVAPGGNTPGDWDGGRQGLGDAPGVNLQDTPRVMTSLRRATAAEDNNQLLNQDVRPTGVADPGNDVPDILFSKLSTNPTITAAADPDGFMPAARGWLPSTPRMQRSTGMYVAFTRPGLHRITVRDNVRAAKEGREAQDKGRQTLWYDKTIAPVVVSMNGQIVADAGTITLVQTQRVRVTVTPNGGRRYAATLLRPAEGTVLRSSDANDPLVLEAGRANGTEDVEISRVYHYDTTTGKYDHPAIQRHGVHLPTDLHIPVRLFTINVVDTLPVRNAMTLAAGDVITEMRLNGTAFILIPTSIGPQGARIVTATAGGAAVPTAPLRPLIQPPPADIPAEIRTFVGTGGVIRLLFTPALNVTAETDIEINVEVGAAAPYAQLKVTLKLRP